MTDERIEGVVRKGVGRVQDAFGGLTGDAATQVRGKINQAAGSAEDLFGQAREMGEGLLEDLEGYARENPLPTLAVTLGVGVVVGLLLLGGRRR